MGKIKYLMLHCTATPEHREVSKKDIEDWHIKGRGWSRVGYSDLIHLDGTLENLIPFNQDDNIDSWELSNGAKGYNLITKHVVYAGGTESKKPIWAKYYKPKDTRTQEQKNTLEVYVKHMILRHPNIKVIGHNEVANKACPSFNVSLWLESINVDLKNIGL